MLSTYSVSIYFLAVISFPATLAWRELHYWWYQSNAKGLIANILLTPQSPQSVGNQKKAVLANLEISHIVQMAVFLWWYLSLLSSVIASDRCCFSVSAVPGGDDLLWSTDHLQHWWGKQDTKMAAEVMDLWIYTLTCGFYLMFSIPSTRSNQCPS